MCFVCFFAIFKLSVQQIQIASKYMVYLNAQYNPNNIMDVIHFCANNVYLNCGAVVFFPGCSLDVFVLANVIVQNLYGFGRTIRFGFWSQGGKVANSTKSLVSDKKRYDEKRFVHTARNGRRQ